MANNIDGSFEDPEIAVLSELLGSQTDGQHDIFSVVLDCSGADYDTLEAETGLSRSAIQYHISRFAELGLVTREGNPVIVEFDGAQTAEIVDDVLEKLAANGVGAEGNLTERARARRERRDLR